VATDVLRQAGKPLPAKEIAKQVLASGGGAGLKGKTPEATISAMLAVDSKTGGPFKRVDKGTYTLADVPTTATTSAEASQPATPKRATTRKTATARSKTRSVGTTRTRGEALAVATSEKRPTCGSRDGGSRSFSNRCSCARVVASARRWHRLVLS
jgi:hypothetical protein